MTTFPRKLTIASALVLSTTQVEGWQTATGPQTKIRLFSNPTCGDTNSPAANVTVLVSRCTELEPGVQGFEILEKVEGCSVRYYDFPGCIAGNDQHLAIPNVCNPNAGANIRSIGLRGCKYGAGSAASSSLSGLPPQSITKTRSADDSPSATVSSAVAASSSAAAASSSAPPDSSYTGGGGGGGMGCCGICGIVFGIVVGIVTIVAGICTTGQCLCGS